MAHGTLDDDHRPRPVDVQDGHSRDCRPGPAGRGVGGVVGADDQRDVGAYEIRVRLASAVTTFVAYAIARANSASDLDADRSAATLTLFLVAFWVWHSSRVPTTLGGSAC